jgi:hypothetical protein
MEERAESTRFLEEKPSYYLLLKLQQASRSEAMPLEKIS